MLLSLFTVVLTLYSVVRSRPRGSSAATTAGGDSHSFRTYFSFHAPTSLFPPSAIISLTDDNSTFFLSRPAAYGPALPSDGLSGQLWVGSGFLDDALSQDGANARSEGELGCSDIPGWPPGKEMLPGIKTEAATGSKDKARRSQASDGKDGNTSRNSPTTQGSKGLDELPLPEEDDGSDDHLHYPLPGASLVEANAEGKSAKAKGQQPPEHADIQSLQESAEIAGKVVLLSRGGCGFLEKTKWVQRRGGVALIVGDNTRGGPLVNMYARGDASNISIPSLFTSHTTAHLLSSLIPPGSATDGATSMVDGGSENQQENGSSASDDAKALKDGINGPNFTPAAAGQPVPTAPPRSGKSAAQTDRKDTIKEIAKGKSWLAGVLSTDHKSGAGQDSRRPPSSGRLDWIQSKDWNDGPKRGNAKGSRKSFSGKAKSEKSPNVGASNGKGPESGDDFVIGVQDWRDPDLVNKDDPAQDPKGQIKATSSSKSPAPTSTKGAEKSSLPGGSRTPGSGVYKKTMQADGNSKSKEGSPKNQHSQASSKQSRWLPFLSGRPRHVQALKPETGVPQQLPEGTTATNSVENNGERLVPKHKEHHGLWVTMTPTSVSTSPFFDTLLVLVVSPLVTLTIVYALLLLRSRIRRRRWRAPKSVVDRLPVRTYHTMSCSTSARSSLVPSPNASSPTSPLLRSVSGSSLHRARPRSQTLNVLRQDANAALDRATANVVLNDCRRVAGQEKPAEAPASAAKKRYSGRQVECVVCLEEYVDGQSRVMSLPCGHEFHADCMYVTSFPSPCHQTSLLYHD